MTTIADELAARLPSIAGLRRRLQPTPAARTAARRGLWGFALVLIVLTGLLPLYADAGRVLTAQQGLILGLLALSLNLLVATTGLISFGQAMFFGFGAYMVAIAFAKLGWPPLLSLALSPVIGAVSAFLIGLVVLRGKELYFALLTLGMGQLVWAAAHGWGGLTGGQNGTTGVFSADYLSPFEHPRNLYWFVFGFVGACTLILYAITRSPFGDALRGIRENRRRAEFTGLWVKRYELVAFIVAGTFGASAGGLWVVSETQITAIQIDWRRSAISLIVCLIGGIGYFLGPFAGMIFYLFVFDYITDRTELWDTVLGLVVLGVALALAGGIVGAIHWLMAMGVDLTLRIRGTPAAAITAVPAEVEEAVHLPEVTAPQQPAAMAAEGQRPVLTVEGLTKRFGGLVAVDNVSFAVRQRAMHAIIGPNGAGKTTLFNVMTGLMKPDEGRIMLEGEDITGTAPWRLVKRGMGRSFQQTNLFWALSSIDNLTLADAAAKDATRKMIGGHSAAARERAGSLLDRVGLGALAGIPAIELSHGDQRSLEVAAALAVKSRLLLLDEPTAGLSPAETRTAVAMIRRLATEQGLTVLFVEHDMEVVFGIADRITVMHRGAILAEGSPEEIRRNPDVQAAYLGLEDEPAAS